MKNQSGITLVAVVVTLVVLLIIAGISVNLVLGNQGILKKAQNAKTNYSVAQNTDVNTVKKAGEDINYIVK